MIQTLRNRRTLGLGIAVLAFALALGGWRWHGEANTRSATLYFTNTKGLYVGNDVTVLGVAVGSVVEIDPGPDSVRVVIDYDADVPADVKAVIAAPSLVPVRSIALTPVYAGGPKLADGAEVPVSRTAVPVEWDEVKAQVDELARLLGPQGANNDGALSRAIDVAARNLHGQGPNLKATITAMAEAMSTLADNRGHLFGTVRNLSVFIEALQGADAEVVAFNGQLASVARFLGDNSDELGSAIDSLNRAFKDVAAFLKDNRQLLAKSVKDMRPLATVLAENRQYLANILHAAPTSLSNLYSIYEPIDGSLAAQLAATNLQSPALLVCTALLDLGGTYDQCRKVLGPLASALAQDPPGVGISAVQRNGRSNQVYARPGPEPAPGSPDARPDLASTMLGDAP